MFKALWHVLVRTLAIMSGVPSLLIAVFLAYQAGNNRPLAPYRTLELVGCVTVVVFILSGSAAWWIEHARLGRLEAGITPERRKVVAAGLKRLDHLEHKVLRALIGHGRTTPEVLFRAMAEAEGDFWALHPVDVAAILAQIEEATHFIAGRGVHGSAGSPLRTEWAIEPEYGLLLERWVAGIEGFRSQEGTQEAPTSVKADTRTRQRSLKHRLR